LRERPNRSPNSTVAGGASTTAGTTDSSWQFCGWNIDGIQITAVRSPAAESDEVGEEPSAVTSESAAE
jgi:hypothetical protein